MTDKEKLLLDIGKKKSYLKKRLNKTNDSIEKKIISFSIASYLQIEYSLSKLNFFVNKIGKFVLKRDFLLEKSTPYLEIINNDFDYYLEDLDLEYVNTLVETLSEKRYTKIPDTINVCDSELIDISLKFYDECFKGIISDYGLDLLKDSSVYFISSDFYCDSVIGKNYHDSYFGDNYSFVKRQYNDIDLVSVPHEVFHGISSMINPNRLLNSIPETEEVGPLAIEYIYYDFLDRNYGMAGSDLKKLNLFNIGFEASSLKQKLFNNIQNNILVHDFIDLETKVIAYGIYLLYKEDKEKGENKLLEFINYTFSRKQLPDYSSLGFSKDTILSLAKMMVEERQNFISEQTKKL